MRDFLASTRGPSPAIGWRSLAAPGLLAALVALSPACGGSDGGAVSDSPLPGGNSAGAAGSAGTASNAAGSTGAGAGGSSTGGGGVSGAGGQGGAVSGGGAPASFSPFGYFDVDLSTVEASIASGPKGKEPPSKTTKLRIDIPEPPSAGAWKAVVTPRWGTPAVFDAKMSDDAIVLTGNVSVVGNYPDLAVTDVWQSFTIPLSAKKAKGVIAAVGQEDLVSGDEGWTGKLVGSGQVSPDATQPEAHPGAPQGFGPSYGILPWDPIPVVFAEPLTQDQALSTLGLFDDAKPGDGVDVLWMLPTQAKATGVAQVFGYLKGWDKPLESPRLHVGTGYVDPAKNPGTGFDQGFAVLNVPAPEGPVQGFEGDVIQYASWGPALQLGGLAPAPECESYGCVLLGPFMNGACGVDAAGVAGRLLPEKDKAKLVRIRLRVLFAVEEATQGVPTYLTNVPALSVQLARPGKLPEAADVVAPSPEDLGEQAGEFRYATPWTTVTRPVPVGYGEVGFALRAGGALASGSCDGNGVKPNLKTKVLIESVALE